MSGFDYSLTTFSKRGRLLQIEYALEAVNKRGQMSIGIRATNGVVIASEKRLPPQENTLIDGENVRKIELVNQSAGFAYAGLNADYRVLVKRARKRSQVSFFFFLFYIFIPFSYYLAPPNYHPSLFCIEFTTRGWPH